MKGEAAELLRETGRNLRDLLPIAGVVVLFQALVIREPMPDLGDRLGGGVLALLGLTLLVRGLAMSIFPLGERMADWLARRGSLPLLLGFGFALGFGSTVAEPALAAVADQAGLAMAAAGSADHARASAFLRYGVAAAVGVAATIGVLRIVKGWPVIWFVLPGYGLASALALSTQTPLSAIAFDAGAAATSAINIPLMLALGIGLAAMIRGRSPLLDGFGLVALASLTPMIVVLIVASAVA